MPLSYEQAKDQILNSMEYKEYTVDELVTVMNKAAELYADSVARDALQKYNEFLLKHGYTDTDIISEEPTAIDQFLKIYQPK